VQEFLDEYTGSEIAMGTNRSFRPASRRCFEALKTFLSVAQPISKRAAMYRLLSMGLLTSTKKFAKFNETLNKALSYEEECGDHFKDDCFVDNQRHTDLLNTWTGADDFREWCAGVYRRDFWQDQPEQVQVWLEKATVSFLVQGTTRKFGVPLQISAGDYSRTFLHDIAKSLNSTKARLTILYVGDFDPSGLNIEKAAYRGLLRFLQQEFKWTTQRCDQQIQWQRFGVTEAEYRSLPANAQVPLKLKSVKGRPNPQAEAFKADYDNYGIEVEALEVLEAGGLAKRLDAEIHKHINKRAWAASKRQAAKDIAAIAAQ
jgi:hypothetical protein